MEEPIRTPNLAIDRFWREESIDYEGNTWSEGYHNDDNLYYFTAESFIIEGILGFCGCGEPELALEYICNVMLEIHVHVESKFTKGYHPVDGSKYIAWYVLAKAGLTEHGGAVPGWLTNLGRDVLHDLLILYPKA